MSHTESPTRLLSETVQRAREHERAGESARAHIRDSARESARERSPAPVGAQVGEQDRAREHGRAGVRACGRASERDAHAKTGAHANTSFASHLSNHWACEAMEEGYMSSLSNSFKRNVESRCACVRPRARRTHARARTHVSVYGTLNPCLPASARSTLQRIGR